jgi:hypothetical protein
MAGEFACTAVDVYVGVDLAHARRLRQAKALTSAAVRGAPAQRADLTEGGRVQRRRSAVVNEVGHGDDADVAAADTASETAPAAVDSDLRGQGFGRALGVLARRSLGDPRSRQRCGFGRRLRRRRFGSLCGGAVGGSVNGGVGGGGGAPVQLTRGGQLRGGLGRRRWWAGGRGGSVGGGGGGPAEAVLAKAFSRGGSE